MYRSMIGPNGPACGMPVTYVVPWLKARERKRGPCMHSVHAIATASRHGTPSQEPVSLLEQDSEGENRIELASSSLPHVERRRGEREAPTVAAVASG